MIDWRKTAMRREHDVPPFALASTGKGPRRFVKIIGCRMYIGRFDDELPQDPWFQP